MSRDTASAPVILGGRLAAMAQEMTAMLAAVVPTITPGGARIGAALLDANLAALAVASSHPALVPALARAPRAMVDAYTFDLAPGDALLTNDPAFGGIRPTFLVLAYPVFVAEELLGVVALGGEAEDLGGDVPRGFLPAAQECLAEGIALPPVRLARGDRLVGDVVDLLSWNSREPEALRRFLEAMLGVARGFAGDLVRLVESWGRAAFASDARRYFDYTERRLEHVLASPPWAPAEGVAAGLAVTVVPERTQEGARLTLTLRQSGGCPTSLPLASVEGAVFTALTGMDQELPPWNDGWQKALAVEADQLVACRGQAVTPGDVRLFPAIVAAVRKAAGLGSRQLPWLPGLLLYRPPKGARPVLYLPPTHGGRQSPPEPIAFSAEELERAGVRVLARELGQGSLELRFENTSGTDLRAVAAEGADLTGPLQEGDRPWRRWPAGGRATYRLQGTGEDAHG